MAVRQEAGKSVKAPAMTPACLGERLIVAQHDPQRMPCLNRFAASARGILPHNDQVFRRQKTGLEDVEEITVRAI